MNPGTHNLVYLVYEVQDQQFVFQYAQKNKYTSLPVSI
jgi:hypothetical protein